MGRCRRLFKHLIKLATNRNTGKLAETRRQVDAYRYTIAVDLKGYDDSVSIETLDVYRDAVIKPTLDALVRRRIIDVRERSLLMELDYHTQRLPILVPPWSTSYGATLVQTCGGISSGERLTSQKGSDINRVRIDEKMKRLGIKGASTNFGDDTTVSSDEKSLAERWMAANDMFGFKEELAPDVSFLMKRMPWAYAYLGRMLLSTINREPNKEPPNVVAAAAGIAIRDELLEGHPLRSHYKRILRANGNDRIVAAVEMADVMSTVDLLVAAHRMKMEQDVYENTAEGIDDLEERGLLTGDEMNRLRVQQEAYEERFQMTFAEYVRSVRAMTLREAEKYIRIRSYTIR
jgi:hypothetical protein